MTKMSKVKSSSKSSKATDKVLSKVKDAGVTKPAQSPKAKSKEIARKLKEKEEKSSRKKKEPTPSSSESESDSDEDMESAESESESEDEKPVQKKAAAEEEESDDSESESDEEDDDEEEVKKVEQKVESKTTSKKDESEDESEESEESESENEAPAKTAEKPTAEESEESEDSEEDSDDSEEESEESKEAPKKRKAEEEPAASAKKSKTETADNSPNLFVGNLSWNVDEEWLRREFEEFGELSGVRIMTERETGRSRGFGYVEYLEASSAKAAYEAKTGAEIDGRVINLDYAKPRDANAQAAPRDRAQNRARSFGDQTSPESNTLFVGNLVFGADENAVRELFEEKGQINGIRLPTDADSGRPKGYGYVEFASVDDARQALNDLQGADIGGRAIRLDFSTPRAQGGGRGGFGGRDGGRSGGRGGGRGGRGGRGGFGGRGRGGATGANSTNRGGFGDFSGKKISFD